MSKLTLVLSSLLMMVSCSPLANLTANERSPDFYQRFVNPSEKMNGISEKLDQVQLLETGEDYPMRMALFSNGKFYYQVDKLGDGIGVWDIQEGALRLRATRPLFDMRLSVSGEKAVGEEMVIRFLDRHGYNSIRIEAKAPHSDLPIYQFSDKGI